MPHLRLLVLVALFLAGRSAALAFNGHIATEGPLTVTIADIAPVTAFDTPQPCAVTLANSAATPLAVTVTLSGLVDDCRAVGETTQRLTVPARGRATIGYRVAYAWSKSQCSD